MLDCCAYAQVFKEGALKRGINCIYIVCKPGDEVRWRRFIIFLKVLMI